MKLRKTGIFVLFLMLFAAAICFREEVAAAMLEAGSRCIMVIIPSLYLFSLLAAFCVRSGVLEILAAPLEAFARKFLHMDGSILMILLFSQTAGYPIGAQLLERMYGKGAIGSTQRNCLLCVCFGCGPAFLLGTVGTILHLPPLLALLLMLSVSLPNLVLAAVLARHNDFYTAGTHEQGVSLHAEEFTQSVENAAAAMLKICSMILAFAAFSGIAQGSGAVRFLAETLGFLGCPAETAEHCILTVLEISNLPEYLQQGGSLPMAAALLSFGGICVHLQNAAICGGDFPWRKFLCIRLVSAVFSYLLCAAAVKWGFGGQVPAVLQMHPLYEAELTTQGVMPVICLLAMSVFLLAKDDRLRTVREIAN